MDRHFDFRAIAGEMFIDGVIQNFEHTVVQTALIWISDIHAWALANCLQTFEFINLAGIVFLLGSDLRIGFFWLVGNF